MKLEIWHNPRCSKSRQALQILTDAGAEVEVRRYLDDPPTKNELDRVLKMLDLQPAELARLGEPVARDLGLKERQLSRARWLELMVENPILIERPVVITGDGRAALGRPPEAVADVITRR